VEQARTSRGDGGDPSHGWYIRRLITTELVLRIPPSYISMGGRIPAPWGVMRVPPIKWAYARWAAGRRNPAGDSTVVRRRYAERPIELWTLQDLLLTLLYK